ncbi:hypothetical protein SAMN04487906_1459 [Zhouia amylolytica]|uniref:3-keto-disaccharide hydrolase domain-containing protein n=2 Tax=Zhouia amylolytica TaxID=376730 RepID=W2UMW2_9FLAO|nr:hypothetical protein [Zhouia amylolytica]ETN94801.1 hypothetical protein P278_27440 [Zhouia amylolytica AD3]MCQ0110981.1 hypothetical protein [Zhouia amylolytica]SFS72900.1 hypothetical protein SAMN04487906_1459 [Zhouia amylolytica]
MKKTTFLSLGMLMVISALSIQQTHAQLWKKIKNKVEKKVEDTADDILNGKNNAPGTSANKTNDDSTVPYVEEVFSYIPGKDLAFEDNFENEREGIMPSKWKTNGSGSVTTISGIEGKWLKLRERSTIKLDTLLIMPENFTVEFDIVTRSEKARDISPMHFGFARDNSASKYISDAYNRGSITDIELHLSSQKVSASSSDTESNSYLDFPFSRFSNETIHVSIAVEGQQMRVYLDKSKILDAKMFAVKTPKHLYISAPWEYDNGAKIFIGNVKIYKN